MPDVTTVEVTAYPHSIGFQSSSVLQSVPRFRRQVETTTEADTTATTTETPTTTAEPLPYDLNYLMVPSVSIDFQK